MNKRLKIMLIATAVLGGAAIGVNVYVWIFQ